MAARLREKEAVLDGVERKRLEQKAAELGAFQAREDSPEALKTIPHLFREDLKAEIEPVPTKIRDAAGIPCMAHPLFTNGISYGDLAFPVDVLEPEDYPWLPFFARAVVSMGLPGMDYGAVSSLLARTAGDFCALLETGSAAPSLAPERSAPARGALPRDGEHEPWTSFIARDWIIYRIKALDEKFPEALDLARRLITGADFSDLRRLRDLVMEMKNDGDASLAPSGHSYASGRSGRSFSRSRAVEELWNGISQIPFTHRLAAMDMGEVRDRMIRLREGLLRGGLVINVTAGENVLEGAVRAVEGFAPLGAPGPANPACVGAERFVSLLGRDGSSGDRAEVYASPSLQVGFAAMSLPAAPYGSPEQAAELVLAHELSTGALWESIRMMGGAYGAFAHPDNLEGVFSFSTYRDPDPLRSLAAFPEILVKRGSASVDGDTLEKTIIGAFARETRPQTPAGRGFSEFLRRLYGIRDSSRLAKLKYITALQDKDTRAAAGRLAAAAQAPGTGGIRGADAPARPEGAFPVIIAGKAAAAGAAKKLGVEVRELPV
ncbi:MAG: hypothetical protein LBD31_03945 [Treponema sp.]|nr:hypothetical protein [Treponema sp.]